MMAESVQIPVNNAPGRNLRTAKMVLYFGIFSILMLFAGLVSAYIVSSYGETWVDITLPSAFYISTVVILLSSLVIRFAVKAADQGNDRRATIYLIVTLILGVAFGVSQFEGWRELTQKGSYFSGSVDALDGVYGKDYTIIYQGQRLVKENGEFYFPNDELREKPLGNKISIVGNTASSYIYVISFVHLMHILGGLIFFLVILLVGKLSKMRHISPVRLRLGAIYWHFVDGLWLFLFLFLLLFH